MIQAKQRIDMARFQIVAMKKRFAHLQHWAGANTLSFDELCGIFIHHQIFYGEGDISRCEVALKLLAGRAKGC